MARYGNQFTAKNGNKFSFDFRDEQALVTLRCYKERSDGAPWDASDEIEIPRDIFHSLCSWLGEYASLRDENLNIT